VKVRLAQSVSIACKGTEKAAGQQFDPEIVRTFLTMPQTFGRSGIDLSTPSSDGWPTFVSLL
jgi:response regulator RpfG family c-di-GMP phosphodiesterase